MKPPTDTYRTKGSDRIQINNILAAVCITILALLLGVSDRTFSSWIVVQLASATPLLITSSFAYAKLTYRDMDEFMMWDNLGWVSLSLGYVMMLNALILLLYVENYEIESICFLLMVVANFVVYNALDVISKPSRSREKFIKLTAYMLSLFFGSVVPIVIGWV